MKFWIVLALLCGCTLPATAAPLKVVASFSVLGDLVKQVGGSDISVTTLVGPDSDTHVYEPTPADVQSIANADVLVVNGLGLEGWMARLQQSAGFKGPVIVATENVKPLQDEHETDPHAWQSVPNAELYVQAIGAGLAKADPAHAADYANNAMAYTVKLQALNATVRAAYQGIPAGQRTVITTHDAFAYYGHEYGLTFLAAEGISTEGEAKPADVAALIRQIRAEKTHAVFIENMSDPRLVQQIATEAGVTLDGELYSDALSQPDGPAATYIDMVTHNTAELSRALRPAP